MQYTSVKIMSLVFSDSARSMYAQDQGGPMSTPFGKALKKLREQAGLSQEELGVRIGRHRTQVNRLESGANAPSWPTVQALAKLFGVSTEEFTAQDVPPAAPAKAKAARPRKKKS
jgi:transcriptional regulator with XRE-family HTH domain